MKIFPTHKWLETWACEGIVNSKKIKKKTQTIVVFDEKNKKDKTPTNPLGSVGKVRKRNS